MKELLGYIKEVLDEDTKKQVLKEAVKYVEDNIDYMTKDDISDFVSLLHVFPYVTIQETLNTINKGIMLNERLLNIESYLDLLIKVYDIKIK